MVVVVLAVYANALPSTFLWDDVHLVVGNPLIKRWQTWPRLFATDLFPPPMASGYYRPLQALTYGFDYQLWGLRPFGFHLTNVLWHAASAVLLYRLGVALFAATAPALVAALLFAVHPLHVEAVTYVAGRSDPLAAALQLMAVLGFLAGDRRGRVLSLLAFFLALLAREAALVLPFLLVAVDRIPAARPRRRAIDYAPYIVAIAAYLALRAMAVGAGGGATPTTAAVPIGLRLLTSGTVLIQYLGLLLVPHALHMERVVMPVASPFDARALAGIAGVAALVVAIAWARRRAWPIALGLNWFLIALLPVANLRPLATFMAEHWLYVPSMGVFLAAGWAIVAGAEARRRPAAAIVVTVFAVLAYGTLTVRRNSEWRDPRTLYESLLPLAPESVRVRINLAEAYQEAGDVDRARVLYEEALRLSPDAPEAADALNNLGNIDREAGRDAPALAAFDAALARNPRHVPALNGRALALQQLGRVDEAERTFMAALALAPESAVTHSNLGNLHFRRDELERAREQYLAAVRLDPDYADAHNNLGSTYFRLGRLDLAEREYRRALQANPNLEGARRNLAVVLGGDAATGN